MSQQPIAGIGQVGNIPQRTDPGQSKPSSNGELIIEAAPDGAVDLSFRGNGSTTLPQAAGRAIEVIANEDAEFKPLTNVQDASMALAQQILNQPQNSKLKGNPEYQQPMAQPVPAGDDVYGSDLKGALGMILEKHSLGELRSFVASTANDMAMGQGSNKMTGNVSPKIPGTGLPVDPNL